MSNQNRTNSSSTIISPMLRPGPSEILYKNFKFLIMDRPTNNNLNNFIDELKKRNVKHVVRVCEPTYKAELLASEGITLHDWQFVDGSPPSNEIVDNWLTLLSDNAKDNPDTYVACHCVAGLGRAPVLVALALIELGMKYEDAIEEIRQKRRGAINKKQLEYLASYKPRYKLKGKTSGKCIIQ